MRGQRMSGLPVEHYSAPMVGGPLCRTRRRWGAVLQHRIEHVNCKRCLRLIAKSEANAIKERG